MKAETILRRNQEIFSEKGKEYGHTYKDFGKIVLSFFPNGIHATSEEEINSLAVFFMMAHKMARIASTNCKSLDSMKDLSIYSAMLEELCSDGENK